MNTRTVSQITRIPTHIIICLCIFMTKIIFLYACPRVVIVCKVSLISFVHVGGVVLTNTDRQGEFYILCYRSCMQEELYLRIQTDRVNSIYFVSWGILIVVTNVVIQCSIIWYNFRNNSLSSMEAHYVLLAEKYNVTLQSNFQILLHTFRKH